MLIIDLINQGEKFEHAIIVLKRLEGQVRRKLEEFNGFQLAMMIYSLVVNWRMLKDLTSCTGPFEYLEHRFNMTESCARKYYRFANILREYRYLFKGIDYKQIKSIHMLDHFKRALENHPEETVMRALTTMSVREFERFSYRRPLYAPSEEFNDLLSKERPESNRTSVFFDYSRYQPVLEDAFRNSKKVLAIGTDSLDQWDRITLALQREGLELSLYEPETAYASTTITAKKPLLSDL